MPARSTRTPLALVLLLLAGAPLGAQTHDHAGQAAVADTTVDPVATGAEHAMSGAADARGHLMLTPTRAATAADSARANGILKSLRPVLERYRDVKVAEADGFRMFAPRVKQQRVFHFTSNRNAVAAAAGFDPARPTSLLYKKDAQGKLQLVGAMYTAPARASLDELDARVPLGIARWHQHVNICIPPRAERARWTEMDGQRMRFGPAGSITTREQCDAAGARWFPRLFGWMVHVNALEAEPWEHGHE